MQLVGVFAVPHDGVPAGAVVRDGVGEALVSNVGEHERLLSLARTGTCHDAAWIRQKPVWARIFA